MRERATTMKVVIKISQYDNGICIKDVDELGNTVAIVSLERTKSESIGELICQHVKEVMDEVPTNEVEMIIEIRPKSNDQ